MPHATRTRLHGLFGTTIGLGAAALLALAWPTAAFARDRGAHAEPSKSQKVNEAQDNPDDPLAGVDLDSSVEAPSKNKGRKRPAPNTARQPGHK